MCIRDRYWFTIGRSGVFSLTGWSRQIHAEFLVLRATQDTTCLLYTSRDTLPTSFPGGWEGYIQTETDAMKLPYLLLAMLLIVIAIIFIFSKLDVYKRQRETK